MAFSLRMLFEVLLLLQLLTISAQDQQVCDFNQSSAAFAVSRPSLSLFARTSSALARLAATEEGSEDQAVMVWQSSGAEDASGLGVYAALINTSSLQLSSNGTINQLQPFRVNTDTIFDQKSPAVAALRFGMDGFVITYESTVPLLPGSALPRQQRILFQIYDRHGNPVGPESQVSEYIGMVDPLTGRSGQGRQDTFPSVTGLNGRLGGFVVTWISYPINGGGNQAGPNSPGGRLLARFFNSDGSPRSSTFQVNTMGDNAFPAQTVAALGSSFVTNVTENPGAGYSVVTYTSQFGCGARVVMAQVLSENGQRMGSPFQVNQYSERDQRDPTVRGLPNGKFVVAWTSVEPGHADENNRSDKLGTSRIKIQLFDEFLVRLGPERLIDPESNTAQSTATIIETTGNPAAEFTVFWNFFNTQTGAIGIQGQFFMATGAPLTGPGASVRPSAVLPGISGIQPRLSIPTGVMLTNQQLLMSWTENGRDVVGRLFLCQQDCQLSPWSEWTQCTRDCDGGTQERRREILKKPQLGGKTCLEVASERDVDEGGEGVLKLTVGETTVTSQRGAISSETSSDDVEDSETDEDIDHDGSASSNGILSNDGLVSSDSSSSNNDTQVDLVETRACNTQPCPDRVCGTCSETSCYRLLISDTSDPFTYNQALNQCRTYCPDSSTSCLAQIQDRTERAFIISTFKSSLSDPSLSSNGFSWISSWQGSNYGGLCEEGRAGFAICEVQRPEGCPVSGI